MVPQISTVLRSVSLVLMVLAIKALVAPHRVSSPLVWPFEEQLIRNLLQNLMHRFSEHHINRLSISRPWLSSKVSPRLVVVVSVQPKIPHLLRDNLNLSFSLLLVFLNPFILINSVHELAHIGDRFADQRFPQTVLGCEADLKSQILGWALWRNLWNLPSGRQTISSPRVPN